MRKSTISKHFRAGGDSTFAAALGAELRLQRRAAGLTQTSLGQPMTRSFVSAVERGHVLPSLAALLLFADRLNLSLESFFAGVNNQMTGTYTPSHEHREDSPARGR